MRDATRKFIKKPQGLVNKLWHVSNFKRNNAGYIPQLTNPPASPLLERKRLCAHIVSRRWRRCWKTSGKSQPWNARKTPHSEVAIEAYAASIAAKGILQNLVVEPELDADGAATGFYLVTIGEGRRLAQLLRVKRKQIKKTEPIRVSPPRSTPAWSRPRMAQAKTSSGPGATATGC